MSSARSALFAALALSAGTLFAQAPAATPPPPPQIPNIAPPPAALTNRCILLVNAAGLPAEQAEAVRAYAENDLWLKVELLTIDAEWAALPGKASACLAGDRKMAILLGKGPADGPLILSAADNNWAMLNVPALFAGVDPQKQPMRLRQGVMRGLGFVFSLPICQDMHCVMRFLQSTSQLDQLGGNYCGPTRKIYFQAARQKGLFPYPKTPLRKVLPPDTAAKK